MRNLLHFYYQNKRRIWIIILIIAFSFALLNIIGNIIKIRNLNNSIQYSTEQRNNNIKNNNLTTTMENNKSLVNGTEIAETKLTKAQDIINKFVENCNNGRIEEAYELLTSDCKKQLYPTINDFKNNYWKELFTTPRQVSISNWDDNIYKVKIYDDILSTGNIKNDGEIIDYVTVIEENNESRLNINSYIGNTNINKKTKSQDLEFTVIEKYTYMNYEIYNIQISNNTDGTIMLDNLEKENSMYLLDSNNTKYGAIQNELSQGSIIIRSNFSTNLIIKFSNGYKKNRTLKYIIFSEVYFNYNQEGQKQNEVRIEI